MERSNGTAPKKNLKIKINVNVDGGNVNQEVNGNGRAVNGAVHQRSTAEKPSNAKGKIKYPVVKLRNWDFRNMTPAQFEEMKREAAERKAMTQAKNKY